MGNCNSRDSQRSPRCLEPAQPQASPQSHQPQPAALPAHLEGRHRMSSVQRRIFLQCQREGGDQSYHLFQFLRLRGPVDLDRARHIAGQIVARHQALRSGFVLEAGEFIVEIHRQVETAIESVAGSEAQIPEIIDRFREPFALDRPPLFRLLAIRLAPEDHLIGFVCHHLLMDGLCARLLADEATRLLAGETLPDVEQVYADYVRWETEFFDSAQYQRQRAFWLQRFRNPPERLDALRDVDRRCKSFAGCNFIEILDYQRIRQLASNGEATVYEFLLSVLFCLAGRLSGQRDITLGSFVSPRAGGGFESVFGVFANTLPLRIDVDPQLRFAELLERVKTLVRQAQGHANYPFDHLIQDLDFIEPEARNPLFDWAFSYETFSWARSSRVRQTEISLVPYLPPTSQFDLAINVYEHRDRLELHVDYCSDVYRETTVRGMLRGYRALIAQLGEQPSPRLCELGLMDQDGEADPAEETFAARPVRGGAVELSTLAPPTFLERFHAQVQINPFNPAVWDQDWELSYRDLNRRAERLAAALVQTGLQTGEITAVLLPKSIDWIISLLALWKARAVYLPLASSDPSARLQRQLADSGAALVLTTRALEQSVAGFPGPVRCLEEREFWPEAARGDGVTAEPVMGSREEDEAGPRPLAYLLYTSGSSGRPKGVKVSHRAVAAHLASLESVYQMRPDDNLLQYAALIFDASLEQVLVALASGARLVLAEADRLAPAQLLELIDSEALTVVELPPAMLQIFRPILQRADLAGLRLLISGGDVLSPELASWLKGLLPAGARLMNFYGPTEATMAATVFEVPAEVSPFLEQADLPIGRPLLGTRAYVLGPENVPLPAGIAGELCLAGERLAEGYLNRARREADAFIELPLAGRIERLYRTGDRVRARDDGQLEFLGRLDSQVQLRGIRIELGEIEQSLCRHPEVSEAVVWAPEQPANALQARIGSATLTPEDVPRLRDWLAEQLPAQLIPARMQIVDRLPRGAAGKIDRQAVRAGVIQDDRSSAHLQDGSPGASDAWRARRLLKRLDPLELALLGLWQDLLGTTTIELHSDLLTLGATSLSAVQVMAEIERRYGVTLPLALMLRSPTIAAMVHALREAKPVVAEGPVVSVRGADAAGVCADDMPDLLLLPGTSGQALELYELIAALPRSYACHVYQWPDRESQPDQSIAAVAAHCLASLPPALVERPPVLLGPSAGGRVALALTGLLEARGTPPAGLLVLDVAAPGGLPHQEAVASELAVLGESASSEVAPTNGTIDYRFQALYAVVNYLAGDGAASQLPAGECNAGVRAALELLAPAVGSDSSLTEEGLTELVELTALRLKAFDDDLPRAPINTELHCFIARHGSLFDRVEDVNRGWRTATRGAYHCHLVAGDHHSMLRGEAVKVLGRKIAELLSPP
jgi:amino acid adenylation domain-containing protein